MKRNLLLIITLLCAVAQGSWGQTQVKNESELTQAVKTDGATIVMQADIELSQPITIQGDNGAAVSATINMNGKKLTDKTSVGQTTAGCIFIVPSGSTLNLSNGSIADVSNITGNNTKYIAGAIVNDGTATLSSVTISGCKGLLGGAIKNNQGAKLNLNTCTFDSNEARTKDGFDSGNGGGIWNGSGSKLSIQGANTVTDNNGLDNADNVFLTNGIVIAVTGSLEGSQIGVSMATPDVFTSGFGANNDKEPLTYFLSDDSDYKIVASDNEAKLVKDMETGIETMSDVRGQMSDVWYDLNGRRLEMKPATKGVYINNGCKVVVKYTKSCAITMKNLRSGQRAKFPSPGNYFPLVDDI